MISVFVKLCLAPALSLPLEDHELADSNDDPDDFPYRDTAYETPVRKFIMKTLLDSIQRGADQIRLQRIPDAGEATGSLSIYIRIGGVEQVVAQPPSPGLAQDCKSIEDHGSNGRLWAAEVD